VHERRIRMRTHKDLEIWQRGMNLVEKIYKETKTFPHEEIYGLTSQIRRSAVSIPSNIAEGAARQGDKEFIQFLYISLGSLSELETLLMIGQRLALLKDATMIDEIEVLRRQLLNFIKYRKGKQNIRKQHG
jgi:four helix bundle protein